MSTPTEEIPQTQAVPEGTKPITKYTAEHGREVGLPSPEAINYMMSVCSLITSTALIGRDMGLSKEQKADMLQAGFTQMEVWEKNQAAIKANSMAKMLVGHEFNPPIPPMAAQQEISIVKSKIFVSYPHLITQMEARGLKFKTIERSHTRAAWEVTRPGEAEPELFEFTIEDAKKAGLIKTSRDGEPLQYELRPRVMLWARLVSETYRATGGRGGVYVNEEKREIEESEDRFTDADGRPYVNGDPPPLENNKSPFVVVQRQVEAGAEPINLKPSNQGEKQEVPVEKSVNGLSKDVPQTAAAATPGPEPVIGRGGKTGTRSHVAPKPEPEAPKATYQRPASQGTREASQDYQDGALDLSGNPRKDEKDDWVPDNIGGKAATPGPTLVQPSAEVKEALAEAKQEPPKTQLDRLKGIAAELAKVGTRDAKSIQKAMQEYILAFTNMPKYLPQPQEKYNEPLDFLEPIASRMGVAFLQDPHKMGLDVGVGWRELKKKVDNWTTDNKGLTKAVALKHFPADPDLVVALIDTACAEEELSEDELSALLWVCLYSSSETAMAFKAAADAKGVSLREFADDVQPVADNEGNVHFPTEGEILTLIAGGGKSVDGQPGDLWQE